MKLNSLVMGDPYELDLCSASHIIHQIERLLDEVGLTASLSSYA